MVQGGELLLSEKLFIEWMLGGMRRSKKDREEFAQENEIQRKMVNFLSRLVENDRPHSRFFIQQRRWERRERFHRK